MRRHEAGRDGVERVAQAVPTARITAGWTPWLPGRVTTRTPVKPIRTATRRRTPMLSPKSGPAMSATIKGDEKVIELNSVSGKNRSAEKAHNVAITRHPARAH